MRWRFGRPGRKYTQIYVRNNNGNLVAWACVRYINDSSVRFLRAHVGDFWVDTRRGDDSYKALMAAILRESKKRKMDMIYVVARRSTDSDRLKSLGFVRRKSLMPVIAFAPCAYDLERVKKWDYRDADADMF